MDTTDAELVLCALLAAHDDGDHAGMRQILDHTPAALRDAMLDLALGELADRTAAQVAEADRLARLLGRGAPACTPRLDLHDELLRHQVVHPFRPVAPALRWELGDRAANALRCW